MGVSQSTHSEDVEAQQERAGINAGKADENTPLLYYLEPRQLDFEQCAKLHNGILDLGWNAVGEVRPHRSWWEYYFGPQDTEPQNSWERYNRDPSTATELEKRLPESLIKFLKLAGHDYPGHDEERSFFLYVKRLWEPANMIACLNGDGAYWSIKNKYICLYESNFGGFVVFNIIDMTARITHEAENKLSQIVPEDDELMQPGMKWMTLESIIEAFVEMIEQNRVMVLREDPDPKTQSLEVNGFFFLSTLPWHLSLDDETIVNITVAAWDTLLSAVESRLPAQKSHLIEYQSSYSEDIIASCDIHGFFLKKFLLKAKVPSFKYVAPGLRTIPSEELHASQPFQNTDLSMLCTDMWKDQWTQRRFKYYPFLFLHGDTTISGGKRVLGYPWENASKFETGLYLQPSGYIERPDGCRLLLPFSMAPGEWQTSSPIKLRYGYDGLYQPKSLTVQHDLLPEVQDEIECALRLELLFKNWTSMIENGHWEVGADGVMGGLEKFKEADTGGNWHLYFLGRTW
ncbi:hypothetical protein BT63DRAFT_424034 [Microthyrium microscopicum]|uniref:Uncharacterized protein n=1 Tax=Microthyrium microscopicum TaxID=703497 RepID=A0A6A6UF50_9PEZI|nr:hypothetical protein BT63DRAFT_424034 [Microthyrium microscopicum]